MLVLAVLLQSSVAPPASLPAEKPVVVTGRRLATTAASLAQCIAQHCSPDKEIDAAIAHAENQFVAGDYKGARQTLRDSRGRNKQHAAAYPVPVADLWRSSARVAAHLGLPTEFRIGMIAATDVLQDAFGKNDQRVLTQQIEIAEVLAQQERREDARAIYKSVADKARRGGLPREEAFALFRLMMMDYSNRRLHGVDAYEARDRLIALTDEAARSYRDAARLIAAIQQGDAAYQSVLTTVMAERNALGSRRPVMIYAPPYKGYERDQARQLEINPSNAPTMPTRNQWMDVAFWIKPDGSVSDVAILRTSDELQPVWIEPVLDVVKGRRYMPMPVLPPEGMMRVERYTYMSWDKGFTGSRIMLKDPRPRVQMLDLTTDAPPAS